MQYNFNNLKFHIITFGCQMNKHDSERICGLLESFGAQQTFTIEDSDIVVYMTCCVREAADVRLYGQAASIKNIKLREDSPLNNRIVAVGGCIGQRDGDALTEKVKNINVVFGTHNIAQLPKLLNDVIAGSKKSVEVLDGATQFPTDLPTHRENAWSA